MLSNRVLRGSADAASPCCMLHMHPLSIGVKPAGGAPCCFQRSASTYDSTARVHDAIRQRVFRCWQVYDGKPTAAGERLAQSIDRPFRHVGRCHVDMCGIRSRELARGALGRYLLGVGAVAAILEPGIDDGAAAARDRLAALRVGERRLGRELAAVR